MRIDKPRSHFRKAASRTAVADALDIDAGAFKQQKQFVRQTLRLDETSFTANPHHSLPLTRLEFFDDRTRRMIFFGDFHGSIRHWAAAVLRRIELFADMLDPGAELSKQNRPDFFAQDPRAETRRIAPAS